MLCPALDSNPLQWHLCCRLGNTTELQTVWVAGDNPLEVA